MILNQNWSDVLMFGFFKGLRESVIDQKLVYLLSSGKDGGILRDVYYEACSKYCEEHGEVPGDPISQCWVSFEGENYNIILRDTVMM